jgi:hypothetical protein
MITRWIIVQKAIGKAESLETMTKKIAIGMIAKTTKKKMLEGWTHPTLARHGSQWVIWSDKNTVFVPLDKATPELLAACPGAAERLELDNKEPF